MADNAGGSAGSKRVRKSPGAFRTISEVAAELDVPQHVLRFWETKFSQIRPLKRAGGRRYYRPEDIELLRRIRTLLYQDGFTIKGVQKVLREGGVKSAAQVAAAQVGAATGASPPEASGGAAPAASAGERSATGSKLASQDRAVLRDLRAELNVLSSLLKKASAD
jgi:DNA-binding transcriptional MerR regulator